MSFKITGTGSYIPELIVTNEDLSEMLDTSDEWITQRVGIKERHISVDETTADMGYKAALKALEMSGTKPEELDLIVAASLTGDNLCPTTAGNIQKLLGAKCTAFDVNSACSGFIFALETAAGFFARGKAKKVLVVGSERMSKILDWTDRGTCVIFGDGAGAAVLEAGEGYKASKLFTVGDDSVINIPTGTNNSPFYKREVPEGKVFMDGQQTFKFAVNTMTDGVKEIVADAGMSLEDLTYIVPHQANIRIIQTASRKLKLPMDKFFVNIDKYGNTSAASIAIALDELNRTVGLKSGDKLVLTAFGGGLSGGICLIEW